MKPLTIYFTSDTHGYLYPTNFVDEQPRAQGLLGMRFPKDGNTLVIDGGDTLQGSPLTYYCHHKGLPSPCARVMNAHGYDFLTLGNHDFNYGYDALRDYLLEVKAQCLCANVADVQGRLPVAPYAVRTMENGLRVGIVGIVTDWVNRWEKPENLTNLRIADPLAAAQKAVEALRGKVDFLIGLYHGGVEKDLESGRLLSHTEENIACRLCEALPFDLLLTGHQHIAMVNRTWHGTHLVQTPCNAVAYVKIAVEANGAIHSELCAPEAEVRLEPWQQTLYKNLQAWLDTPIGHLSRPLWPEDRLTMALHGSPIADFFNAVQLDATGAEVSCTSLGNELRGFDSAVTVRDVVASYVYSNTLVVLRVSGRILRQALEQCATYFAVDAGGTVQIAPPFLEPKLAHYNYDYFTGIEYTFDLRRPVGSRVTRLLRDGVPIAEDAALTLVMNNYRATGAGDFPDYATCERVLESQTEVSELILNYWTAHPNVEVPDGNAYTVILPDGRQA